MTESSTSALRTELGDLLCIRYPIIQAGMSGGTTPELVAGVSNACGLGTLGAGRFCLPLLAGQGLRLLKPGQVAAEIVAEVASGAMMTLMRLRSLGA